MSYFQFDNSYAALAPQFYSHQTPTPVKQPKLIRINQALAEQLGIDSRWLESEHAAAVLSGNEIAEGSTPIATIYAGHQFGMWNPQLGDGRAILLGEVIDKQGQRYDIQLKGSGRTPYSRSGDGRSPLGPVLREYLISESMAAMDIPTTRALAAVSTGEAVVRESLLPGAILTRVAKSHIRVGTFEFFASRNDTQSLTTLANHVIERHYPEIKDAQHPYQALLKAVINAQAKLVAQWQGIGFIHGVMNTDNMLLSGETIDYGPCAFMDNYHPRTCFSSIDQQKRYAYGNQPQIAHWNMACLAQCLLLIMDDNEAKALKLTQEAVDEFPQIYAQHYLEVMRAKLGLLHAKESDQDLILDLLQRMEQHQLDFTLTFRHLSDQLSSTPTSSNIPERLFTLPEDFAPWIEQWQQRLAEENQPENERIQQMHGSNPALIPRNHIVEEAIELAVNQEDLSAFHAAVDALQQPYDYQPELEKYATPPKPEQVVENTFCGT